MCSAGGPMDIEIIELEEKEYRCRDCGERFRSTLENPVCPACRSSHVYEVNA